MITLNLLSRREADSPFGRKGRIKHDVKLRTNTLGLFLGVVLFSQACVPLKPVELKVLPASVGEAVQPPKVTVRRGLRWVVAGTLISLAASGALEWLSREASRNPHLGGIPGILHDGSSGTLWVGGGFVAFAAAFSTWEYSRLPSYQRRMAGWGAALWGGLDDGEPRIAEASLGPVARGLEWRDGQGLFRDVLLAGPDFADAVEADGRWEAAVLIRERLRGGDVTDLSIALSLERLETGSATAIPASAEPFPGAGAPLQQRLWAYQRYRIWSRDGEAGIGDKRVPRWALLKYLRQMQAGGIASELRAYWLRRGWRVDEQEDAVTELTRLGLKDLPTELKLGVASVMLLAEVGKPGERAWIERFNVALCRRLRLKHQKDTGP